MRPFIKGKFANTADLPDVPATANVGNEFNYLDGIAPATAIDKSEGGLPQDRTTLNSGLQLLSKFAVGIQNGEYTLQTFDTRMTVAPMTGYSVDSILYYNDVANSVWLVLKSTKDNNTDDFTQNPSYIGTSWTQVGILPYTLSVLAKPAFQAGQIMFGLWKSLPSASYVWGDAGRQQLNNASVNYPHLVNAITSGLIPYDNVAAWDAAYAAHPDNVVSFWGYDPANNIIIIPNIPRGYGMTAAGSLANVGTVLQNAAPNITGSARKTFNRGIMDSFSGACTAAAGVQGSANDGTSAGWVPGGFNFNASLSSAAYGRDSTTRVRGDQIQMRVMFYVGAEVSPQEANQITAANIISELHSKLSKPSEWSIDDYASMRSALYDVDWDNRQALSVTTTNQPIGTSGLLVGFINAGTGESYLYINNIEVSREANDYAKIQMFVKSTDLIRASYNAINTLGVLPYKNVSGTNNLILGLNYFGKYDTLANLNTASATLIASPLGKGRWALVGNDTDGYIRFYTAPTDGAFATFTWEVGAPDTTDGDYVVATGGDSTAWYRKYKSGWVEQGGQFTATSVADGTGTAGNNTINLPIKMANDTYWYSANTQVGGSGWNYANGVILNARSQTTLTLKVVAGTGNCSLFWEVKGMAQ